MASETSDSYVGKKVTSISTGYKMLVVGEDIHHLKCQLPESCMGHFGWVKKSDIKELVGIYDPNSFYKLQYEGNKPKAVKAEPLVQEAEKVEISAPIAPKMEGKPLNIFQKVALYKKEKPKVLFELTSPNGKQIRMILGDCKQWMAHCNRGEYSVIVADPPYGLDFTKYVRTNSSQETADRYKTQSRWDEGIPDDEYFEFCEHVSHYQIYWGANYFPYIWRNGVKCVVTWYKKNPVDNFADSEIAICTVDQPARVFEFQYFGNISGNTSATEKHHPTQKPVELYNWIFKDLLFRIDVGRVLDTHGGSGTSVQSAYFNDVELDWVEYDEGNFWRAVDFIKKVCLNEGYDKDSLFG